MLGRIIKQYLCDHKCIDTVTEVKTDASLLIVKSRIICADCMKVFPQHPNAQCCYVHHLHGEIIKEKMIYEIHKMNQLQPREYK